MKKSCFKGQIENFITNFCKKSVTTNHRHLVEFVAETTLQKVHLPRLSFVEYCLKVYQTNIFVEGATP